MLKNKVCRVCIISSSTSTLFSLLDLVLLDAEGNQVHMHEMLSYCCSVQFDTNSSLLICASCSESCSKAYNFIKLFHKNNEKFQSILNKKSFHKEIKVEDVENDSQDFGLTKVDAIEQEIGNNDNKEGIFDNFKEFSDEEKIEEQININFIRNTKETEVETKNNQVWDNVDENEIWDDFQSTSEPRIREEISIINNDMKLNIYESIEAEKNDQNFEEDNISENLEQIHQETEKRKYSSTQHECPICNKTFGRYIPFKTHISQHSDQEFTCLLCSKRCTNYKQFEAHYYKGHYTFCDLCNSRFATRSSFTNHMSRKHNPFIKTPNQRIAKNNFESIEENGNATDDEKLKLNYATKYHKCPICDETFFFYVAFTQHLSDHPNGRFKCHLCSKEDVDYKQFEEHYFKDHYTYCHICNIRYSTRNSFTDHISRRHKQFCGTLNQINAKKHSKLNKVKKKYTTNYHECPLCNKKYAAFPNFTQHLKGHANQLFECRLCNKKDINCKEFEEHYFKDHYTCCHICNIRFSTRKSYHSHMHSRHKEEFNNETLKPTNTKNRLINDKSINGNKSIEEKGFKYTLNNYHKCPVCNKYYSFYPNFTKHLKEHSNKIFQCLFCDKKYTDSKDFEEHYFKDHYTYCQICNIHFPTRFRYKRHKTIWHSKAEIHGKLSKKKENLGKKKCLIKRYIKCPLCVTKFRSYISLKRHVSQHPDQEFICNICNKLCVNYKIFQEHYFKDHYTYCSICDIRFSTRFLYKRHKNNRHSNTLAFRSKPAKIKNVQENCLRNNIYCKICNVCFSTQNKYKWHLGSLKHKKELIGVQKGDSENDLNLIEIKLENENDIVDCKI